MLKRLLLIRESRLHCRGAKRSCASIPCSSGEIERYVSSLQRCGQAGALAEGRSVHTEIVASGYDQDRLVKNYIVQMYGKCGSIKDAEEAFEKIQRKNEFSWNVMLVAYSENGELQRARNLFERMPQQNSVGWSTMLIANARYGHLDQARTIFDRMPFKCPVAWGAMISAYSQNGHCSEALNVFRSMELEGQRPTQVIFVIVLDACYSISQGEAFHSRIVCNQLHQDGKIGSCLVNMYSKLGRCDKAWDVFGQLSERSIVSWNAMIGAFARDEQHGEALQLFREMVQEGMKPGKVTFLNVLGACGHLLDLKGAGTVHSLIVEAGLEQDVAVGSALVTMYGKCGSILDARNLFNRMTHKTVVSWTAMITASSNEHNIQLPFRIFREMQLDGKAPNEVTMVSVLDAFTSPLALHMGRAVHACVSTSSLQAVTKVCNALITMYGKCCCVQEAANVFYGMPKRDPVTWTSMIAVYARNQHGRDAVELFKRMDLDGIKTTPYTFTSVLGACTDTGDLKHGRMIHGVVQEQGLEANPLLGNALINMYGRNGCLDEAEVVFKKLHNRSVVSWTTMIDLYAHSSDMKTKRQALEGLALMDFEGSQQPNEVTFISALDACAGLTDLSTGNALSNMYAKSGSLQLARQTFDGMKHKDEVSWNSLMTAYCNLGHGMQTLELFYEMNLEGLKPGDITFSTVLCACSHRGLVEDGVSHFFSMSYDFGALPGSDHYACLVEVLARGGLIEDAEDLIRAMPYEADAKTVMRLLSACRMQGDVKRARVYADKFRELNPGTSIGAAYVLLCNTYLRSINRY